MMFERAEFIEDAIHAKSSGATLLAGGTSVVDLMQLGLEIPSKLTYLETLGLDFIEHQPNGAMVVGSLCHQSRLAHDSGCAERFPLLSEAILSGASPQIRNMATVGGNLLQRTRCSSFRDFASPCNKRKPGSGCPALEAPARGYAIFGRSENCIATFPSDQATALVALHASVTVRGRVGPRTIPLEQFFLLPGDTPHRDNDLACDEVLLSIHVAAESANLNSAYVKIRDRQSYVFAIASAAVALRIEQGRVTFASIVMGSVAARPWRATESESAILNGPATDETFEHAARLAIKGAHRVPETEGKIRLTKAAVLEALYRAYRGGQSR